MDWWNSTQVSDAIKDFSKASSTPDSLDIWSDFLKNVEVKILGFDFRKFINNSNPIKICD